MKPAAKHIYIALATVITAVVMWHAFSIGYGTVYVARADTMPQPSTLDVIYERNDAGATDFLHLEIDTSYVRKGRGEFLADISCRRTMSMRRFYDTYRPVSAAPSACFVTDPRTPQWHDTGAVRDITGYACRMATASFNGRTWEVWYTEELPRCDRRIRPDDGLHGLILEARALDGEPYTLKARYISEKAV